MLLTVQAKSCGSPGGWQGKNERWRANQQKILVRIENIRAYVNMYT